VRNVGDRILHIIAIEVKPAWDPHLDDR